MQAGVLHSLIFVKLEFSHSLDPRTTYSVRTHQISSVYGLDGIL